MISPIYRHPNSAIQVSQKGPLMRRTLSYMNDLNNQTDDAKAQPTGNRNFIQTTKAKLYTKNGALNERYCNKPDAKRLSNFDILKKKIDLLNSSEFLRQNRLQIGDSESKTIKTIDIQQQEYIVGNEFSSSKRVALLEKYKKCLQQSNRRKKASSSFLLRSGSELDLLYNAVSIGLPPHKGHAQNQVQRLPSQRKYQTPSLAKKYFRPKNVNHRSHSCLRSLNNEIRGKGLLLSSNRSLLI